MCAGPSSCSVDRCLNCKQTKKNHLEIFNTAVYTETRDAKRFLEIFTGTYNINMIADLSPSSFFFLFLFRRLRLSCRALRIGVAYLYIIMFRRKVYIPYSGFLKNKICYTEKLVLEFRMEHKPFTPNSDLFQITLSCQ